MLPAYPAPRFPELTRDEVFMIGTPRLWLRWPRHDDAPRFAAINGHPNVATMTASWPVGCDAAHARERIATMRAGNAAGTHLTLAIARRGDWFGMVGSLGIGIDPETGAGQLGYALDPACRGLGLMPEAVAGLLDMTKLLTRMPRVEAGVMPHNAASMRVLEKCGFVRGAPYVFESKFKGPVEVIGFARDLSTWVPRLRPEPSRRARERRVDDCGLCHAAA